MKYRYEHNDDINAKCRKCAREVRDESSQKHMDEINAKWRKHAQEHKNEINT